MAVFTRIPKRNVLAVTYCYRVNGRLLLRVLGWWRSLFESVAFDFDANEQSRSQLNRFYSKTSQYLHSHLVGSFRQLLCEVALYSVNYVTTKARFKNGKLSLIEANIWTNRW